MPNDLRQIIVKAKIIWHYDQNFFFHYIKSWLPSLEAWYANIEKINIFTLIRQRDCFSLFFYFHNVSSYLNGFLNYKERNVVDFYLLFLWSPSEKDIYYVMIYIGYRDDLECKKSWKRHSTLSCYCSWRIVDKWTSTFQNYVLLLFL